jgi:hypothetical protein
MGCTRAMATVVNNETAIIFVTSITMLTLLESMHKATATDSVDCRVLVQVEPWCVWCVTEVAREKRF